MPGTHGPQHDNFRAQSGEHHGGAQHDEAFRPAKADRPHGAQHDEFGTPSVADQKHGAQWDEFPWEPMPVLHGSQFDQNFAERAALTSGEHGTWHDVFRGAKVRAIVSGADVEGTVLNTGDDHAFIETSGGARHEIGLGQIREFRRANTTATPNRKQPTRPERSDLADDARGGALASMKVDTAPPSTAHAPSAHDAKASGGSLRQVGKTDEQLLGDLVDVTKAGKVGAPSGGTATRRRATTTARKAAHQMPVLKHGGWKCHSCKYMSWREHPVITKGGKPHATLAMRGCARCGTMHPTQKDVHKTFKDAPLDVVKAHVLEYAEAEIAKSIDASETAVQGDTVKTVGHRQSCPKGGSAPCGAAVSGQCSLCQTPVHDHQAEGK